MPHRPIHLIPLAAAATTALITAALTTPPAHAAPCGGTTAPVCFPESEGSQTGGTGGTGGTGAGGGTVTIPTLPGDDQGLGVGGNPVAAPPPAAPSTIELAEQARSEAQLPPPTVHTAPDGETYVRVRTALWVDGFETVQTPPVSAGDQLVQATATPQSVRWQLGETTLTCDGPGAPNSTECSHVYKRSSARSTGGVYQITATIVWNVTWECEGAECDAPSGEIGEMTMTSPPTPLNVDEIQTNSRP